MGWIEVQRRAREREREREIGRRKVDRENDRCDW